MFATALVLFASHLSAPTASASEPGPVLAIRAAGREISATVSGPEAFLGAVLLSPSPDVAHYLVDLPPLLADFVVLGMGKGEAGTMVLQGRVTERLPEPIQAYGQAVVLGSDGILSSEVVAFELKAD